jgi:aldose 1-epimerase
MNLPASKLRSITLQNRIGARVELLNLGAAINSFQIPLGDNLVEMLVCYPRIEDYLHDPYHLGATVGRYANRLANASLLVDGKRHQLTQSPGQNGHCLHGGPDGFSRRLWDMEASHDGCTAQFTLISADGDQGFPGRLKVTVNYQLGEDCTLDIDFKAVTEAPTMVSLANHAYFNLNTDGSSASNHHLQILADTFTPVSGSMIPTGEIRPVADGPFDFRKLTGFSERLETEEPQLAAGHGYDHNFVLARETRPLSLAARLLSPLSGLGLEVLTTQPGLQFYSGHFLGPPFRPHAGLCLEAQGWPDAPNHPDFPTTRLNPGERYQQRTRYRFFQT